MSKRPVGIKIRVKDWPQNLGIGLKLVPCSWLPLYPQVRPVAGRDECPTCGVIHLVKTVHLNIEPGGTCLVSEGVLAILKQAGLEEYGIEQLEHVYDPPPLRLNGKATRAQVDQENRKLTQWVHT